MSKNSDVRELSIVIPFYNEETSVRNVVEQIIAALRSAKYSFEIVCVQNGSIDRTPEILESLQKQYPEVLLVPVAENKGFGFGVIQGLKASHGEVLGYMPGDGQIDAAVVPMLLQKMKETQADIGKGRRIARDDGHLRWFISKSYNLMAKILFQSQVADWNAPPKLFTREAYSMLNLTSDSFFIEPELILKAQQAGLKFCQIDIRSTRRPGKARSKVAVLKVSTEFAVKLIRLRFSSSKKETAN